VVNKFDEIRNKERCRRVIEDQIKQLSPRTYAQRDQLVHFVSAKLVVYDSPSPKTPQEFERLEDCLRTFVLKKRTKSKLAPVGHFLDNLLTDIGVLAEYNRDIAEKEYARVMADLNESTPHYRMLRSDRDRIVDNADKMAENTCEDIQRTTKQRLERVIASVTDMSVAIEYPGLPFAWQYALDIRDGMLQAVHNELQISERNAREQTAACIASIEDLAVEHNLIGEAKKINVDKIFGASSEPISVHIVPTDFIDFDYDVMINEKLGMIGLSSTAMVMVNKFGARTCT
jgi:mitofusin